MDNFVSHGAGHMVHQAVPCMITLHETVRDLSQITQGLCKIAHGIKISRIFMSFYPQVPPYLQEPTGNSSNSTGGGGNLYEGYIVDLLDEIAKHLCIGYEISLAADGKFGSQQGDEWTGIIGDVVKGVGREFTLFFKFA